jgi:hypothetical protein
MTADRRRGVRCVSRQWSVLYACVKMFEGLFFFGWGVVFLLAVFGFGCSSAKGGFVLVLSNSLCFCPVWYAL